MSLSVGALLGAVGSAAGSASSSLFSSYLNSVWSDSNNKDSQSRSQTYSTKNLIYDYLLNRQAVKEDAQVNYDYSLAYARERDQDQYDLAHRYAENSASWEKQGMINAGINPILAYGSLGSGIQYSPSNQALTSSGGSSVSADTPGAGSPGVGSGKGLDIAEALRDIKSLDVAEAQESNLKAQTTTTNDIRPSLVSSAKADAEKKSAEVSVTNATAEKIRAEAANITANTAKTELENASRGFKDTNIGVSFGHKKFGIDVPVGSIIRAINLIRGNPQPEPTTGKEHSSANKDFEADLTVEGHNTNWKERNMEKFHKLNPDLRPAM